MTKAPPVAAPRRLEPSCYPRSPIYVPPMEDPPQVEKKLVGIDVFVQARMEPDALAKQLTEAAGAEPELTMITNRGVRVWPNGQPQTLCTDHWRCRFMGNGSEPLTPGALIDLLLRLSTARIEFVKTEHLYDFDGEPGYSLGQGQ